MQAWGASDPVISFGTQERPFDLSSGQSRSSIPKGAFYRDPQGNLRRNENGDAGNPIVTPPPKRGDRRGIIEESAGALANLYRGTGVMDEVVAGMSTAGDVLTGNITPRFSRNDTGAGLAPMMRGVGDAYTRNMAAQRRIEDGFAARRPDAATGLRSTGMAATMFVPGGATEQMATAPSRLMGAARGATVAGGQGYLMGLADRGTLPERMQQAGETAVTSAALGGALGGLAARGVPKKAKPPTNVDILRSYGIEPTMGQSMGGFAKNAEDLGLRAPILGPAIAGARARVNTQFTRAPALAALRPIGERLPRNLEPGFDTVAYVDSKLGKVYDDAAAMVPRVNIDDQLAADISAIAGRKADLPQSQAAQFDSIVADRLARLRGDQVSGETIKTIQGELRALAREQKAKGETSLGSMLDDSAEAVMGLVARANPEAAAMIRQADEGWRIYSMMNDASAAANAKGGVFVPGQFNSQVRSAGKGVGSNMTGKGFAPMQDLATAASSVLPDQFGNPGSANAIGLGALAMGTFSAPAQTVALAGGLTAASTPYFLAARRVVEELPPNVGKDELEAVARELADLAVSDPSVAPLLQSVQARLGRFGGVVGSAATLPPPRVQPTYP
jgi:hypothetical protein